MQLKTEPSKWDNRFFELCDLIASWSEDRSRKVGAVIVGPANEIRSTGFNGLPRGTNGTIETRHAKESGEKYFWFEHAERNAIYNAARVGLSIENCKMYVSVFPCADCARAIIQSGIIELRTKNPPKNDAIYEKSFEFSKEMLKEANVNIRLFD